MFDFLICMYSRLLYLLILNKQMIILPFNINVDFYR